MHFFETHLKQNNTIIITLFVNLNFFVLKNPSITNQVFKLLIKELLPDICAALLVVMDAPVHLHKNAKH